MSITSAAAEKLATMNINLEITPEASYTPTTVEKLIKTVTKNNLHITIHAGSYTPTSLEKFAKIGGPNVTIKI